MKALRAALAVAGGAPWGRAVFAPELPPIVRHAVDAAYLALCHHLPARTLVLRGEAMCVCSRCAGLYAGIFFAALVPVLASRTYARTALPVALFLMATDIATQDLGLHAPSHAVRLATGALVGWLATSWMLSDLRLRPAKSFAAP